MSLDAIKKIAEAEAQAKNDLQEANGAAKQQVSDAEARGRSLQQERQKEAQAKVKQLMLDAEAQGAKRTEEILHHAENQCAVLRTRGEGRLSQAADRIVERIVMS